MCRDHLKSYDAYHAATALALGVRDFATVDADFTRVTELTVHLLRDSEPNA
jgi:predicted nucleic acid-binding protein